MAIRNPRMEKAHRHHKEVIAEIEAAPTEHIPRHVSSLHVHELLFGSSAIGRLNNWLAVTVTRAVGTMWAAYLFVLISLVSLPQAMTAFLHGDRVTGINWLSQSFLQLILLPIIIVGQNVISTAQDARAAADHETLTALHVINVRQLKLLEQQEKILELLRERSG